MYFLVTTSWGQSLVEGAFLWFFSLYSRPSWKAIWPEEQVPSYLKLIVAFFPPKMSPLGKVSLWVSQVLRKAFKGDVRAYRCEKMIHGVRVPTSGALLTRCFFSLVHNALLQPRLCIHAQLLGHFADLSNLNSSSSHHLKKPTLLSDALGEIMMSQTYQCERHLGYFVT